MGILWVLKIITVHLLKNVSKCKQNKPIAMFFNTAHQKDRPQGLPRLDENVYTSYKSTDLHYYQAILKPR